MIPLLLATRNAHKTAEFAAILGDGFHVHDLRSEAAFPEVEETGATFEENAVLKARSAARITRAIVVADDSGLVVDALHGAPGVRSARYAGEGATDAENVAKLLRDLRTQPAESRSAYFACVLALAQNDRVLEIFEGRVDGRITMEASGAGGFGYDPIFIPANHDRTFAELGEAMKNTLSHRARAIAKLREYLTQAKPRIAG